MSAPVLPPFSWLAVKQFLHGFFPGPPTFVEKDYPSLDGKVVIVTGGSAGAGYETAKSLAGATNAKVYIFARNEEKTLNAIKRLELEVAKEYNKPKVDVHFIKIDLGDLTTIRPAAEKFLSLEQRLDIVIHNAGIKPDEYATTKQGYEIQLGTNAIGPHLLQKYLDPLLIKTSQAAKPLETRVVWVGSTAHWRAPLGGVHWADPNLKDSVADLRYAQSKAINVIQAIGWHKYHPDAKNVLSLSVCPGYLSTDIQGADGTWKKTLSNWILYPSRNGAFTELFAALSPGLGKENQGGHIISFGHVAPIREDVKDDLNVDKTWNYLEEQVKSYI
ncbi:short-chain alcohol dehydrogenase [Scheffersomyces xylosifermentans]|uniref:short-chain alcohol dehydrogenase n=1 Tax=Scheffersomyces xylosifermentans TaxID=1304137 RepID=UPI00315D4A40